MKYEVIIFDADETLFDFKRSEKEAFMKSIVELGLPGNPDELYRLYHQINSVIWKEFEKGLISQKELKIERFHRFAQRIGVTLDAHQFENIYTMHLANASYLYDTSEELIKKLHQDHRLVILTNGLKTVQDKRIRKSVIAHYFEAIIVSEEVGFAKPDPRLFDYTLKEINYTNKEKVLMVGDNLSSDIQGGINFGLDTCWFNPSQKENQTHLAPTYEIKELLELSKFVY